MGPLAKVSKQVYLAMNLVRMMVQILILKDLQMKGEKKKAVKAKKTMMKSEDDENSNKSSGDTEEEVPWGRIITKAKAQVGWAYGASVHIQGRKRKCVHCIKAGKWTTKGYKSWDMLRVQSLQGCPLYSLLCSTSPHYLLSIYVSHLHWKWENMIIRFRKNRGLTLLGSSSERVNSNLDTWKCFNDGRLSMGHMTDCTLKGQNIWKSLAVIACTCIHNYHEAILTLSHPEALH